MASAGQQADAADSVVQQADDADVTIAVAAAAMNVGSDGFGADGPCSTSQQAAGHADAAATLQHTLAGLPPVDDPSRAAREDAACLHGFVVIHNPLYDTAVSQ
jgi:hypothetical protein